MINNNRRAVYATDEFCLLLLIKLRAAPIRNSHNIEMGKKKTSPSRLVKVSINNWRVRTITVIVKIRSTFFEVRAMSRNKKGASK